MKQDRDSNWIGDVCSLATSLWASFAIMDLITFIGNVLLSLFVPR